MIRGRGGRCFVLVAALLAPAAAGAQQRDVDVRQYDFAITLPDTGAVITARATVRFVRGRGTDTLRLDLVGMTVDSVRSGEPSTAGALASEHDGHVLRIALGEWREGAEDAVAVWYHGAPSDALAIRANSRGTRAAFADNWPNRARYWLPTVDHPGDKARVRWEITAPPGWRVVANGARQQTRTFPDGHVSTVYVAAAPIPTYTMVLGAGPMAVSRHRLALAGRELLPVEVWTFREDSAFADSVPFRRATEIIETLQRIIGPFPYEKLAHVESSTRYGGMENSSAIFYAEQQYVRRTMGEGVVRHETAHQWFGDAVTPREWPHLWLSEGFASYFDLVAGAVLGGDSVLARGMRRNFDSYARSDVVDRPLADTATSDPNRLLNANAYEKGAWVLHMLRRQIGDGAFFRGIREYYRIYRDSSVTSREFQRVMERASGEHLEAFFADWLYRPGYPQLDVSWESDMQRRRLTLRIRQIQPAAWGRFGVTRLPVHLAAGGRVFARREVALDPTQAEQTFTLELDERLDEVRIDPDGVLLLAATVRGPHR